MAHMRYGGGKKIAHFTIANGHVEVPLSGEFKDRPVKRAWRS